MGLRSSDETLDAAFAKQLTHASDKQIVIQTFIVFPAFLRREVCTQFDFLLCEPYSAATLLNQFVVAPEFLKLQATSTPRPMKLKPVVMP